MKIFKELAKIANALFCFLDIIAFAMTIALVFFGTIDQRGAWLLGLLNGGIISLSFIQYQTRKDCKQPHA